MKVKACKHKAHHAGANQRVEKALEKIRAKGIRVTAPRREILRVLAASSLPLSSEEVFSEFTKGGDLVTVYRSLATLEELNLVRRYDLGDGVRRYELLNEQHHHHYIRCRGCGDVEPFEGCEFESNLSKTLERKGYRMLQHTLDVQALCSRCVA